MKPYVMCGFRSVSRLSRVVPGFPVRANERIVSAKAISSGAVMFMADIKVGDESRLIPTDWLISVVLSGCDCIGGEDIPALARTNKAAREQSGFIPAMNGKCVGKSINASTR